MNILTSYQKYKSISFGNNIDQEKINSTRIIVIMGSLLYGLYTIIDLYGLPKETLMVLFPPRIVSFLYMIAILGFTFKRNFFLKNYNIIL